MEPRTLCETRRTTGDRSKAVWGMRGTASVLRTTIALALLTLLAAPIQAASSTGRTATSDKLDHILAERASKGIGRSRVIVVFKAGADGSEDVRRAGGSIWRKFSSINGQAVEIANGQLRRLAESSAVESLHVDRPLNAHLNRAAVTIGARAVQEMGYDGAGVGVAVIDSGVTSWHDDLTYNGVDPSVQVVGGQRVAKFVDFVNGRTAPYDDNGHGTHVSGIIAGNGYDTRGARAGIAPAAHIVSQKVLNSAGSGYISNDIAALDWSITNQSAYNIRVINLSVGAPITESYTTDPLTLAAKRVVDSGIVVVAAAGNLGRNSLGNPQYGGITSPGNAPWVLTVGASNTKGTITRTDDEIAPYSSRGPSAIDYSAKPDVIAPGTGIASLSDPTSSLYVSKAANLLAGTLSTSYKPYLALSGTSMAAPMVAGTAALMIQANPKLTPNLVKAILEYTAQKYAYDTLTQGAGFLNTRGAVELARFFVTAKAGQKYPSAKPWGRTIIWANQRLTGGVIKPAGSAWGTGISWGSAFTGAGANIVWGTLATDFDNIVWGTSMLDAENIVWGTMTVDFSNIVWGTSLSAQNIVWGTLAPDTNVVWGAQCAGANCENIVWGSSLPQLDNIVWGTTILEANNIVWGTCGDFNNIVWGTADATEQVTPLYDDPATSPPLFDVLAFDSLFTTDPTTVQSTTSGVPMTTVVEPVVQPAVQPVVQPVAQTTSVLGGGF
ncbi:MAG: S8 family peptidase [Acidobacteria bacterium]|nr:S8 family peptidase [Acidobacteriota bacterium]